jgi:5-methylcytosine-specific restriction endonuclease McrA
VPSDFKPPKRIRDAGVLAQYRLERVGEPCERCERRIGVEVHHKVFRSQGGSDAFENLAWLCGVCHDEAHGIRRVT